MTQRKRSQEVSFLTYPRNLDFIGVRGGEVGGASAPPVWKNFRASSVFRASASCSKILNYKKYFNAAKIFRATLFFRASASCSNILNDKKYIYSIQWIQDTFCFSEQQQVAQKKFNTVKNFRATLFYRASASCSNIPNDKIYIFNTVNSGHILFFGATANCSKKIQYSEKFQGKLCFQGKHKLLKNPEL